MIRTTTAKTQRNQSQQHPAGAERKLNENQSSREFVSFSAPC
jgi:hypothetical protein